MKVYAYESHLGGIYFSHTEYDIDDLYCEQCHDYNWLIGEADNTKDMIAKLSKYLVVEPTDGGYDLSEILEDIKEYFDDIPTLEEAKRIVQNTRKEEGWYDDE